jgi:dipeptidase E
MHIKDCILRLALLSNQDTRNGKEAIRSLLSSNLNSTESGSFIASQPDPERFFYRSAVDTYKSIGFEIGQYLDFEEGYSDESFEKALSCPFIHLSGGNTFRFLSSIRERGAESRLVEYARNGGILIGISAGAMILTQSIESALICGDENLVGLSDLRGLGLVSFMFDPHSNKQDTNTEGLKSKFDLLMASDDDAYVVINGKEQFVGDPKFLERANA